MTIHLLICSILDIAVHITILRLWLHLFLGNRSCIRERIARHVLLHCPVPILSVIRLDIQLLVFGFVLGVK